MKNVFKLVWFWTVAYAYTIYQLLRGNTWHMMHINWEVGGKAVDGAPRRVQLIARRTCGGVQLYWQDIDKLLRKQG